MQPDRSGALAIDPVAQSVRPRSSSKSENAPASPVTPRSPASDDDFRLYKFSSVVVREIAYKGSSLRMRQALHQVCYSDFYIYKHIQ